MLGTAQLPKSGEQFKVLLSRFTKAEPRINDHPIKIDAKSAHISQTRVQKCRNILHHIVVGGCRLHRIRLTLHVHHTERQAGICGCLQRPGAFEAAHIIEKSRSMLR